MLDFNWSNTPEFIVQPKALQSWLEDVCASEGKTLSAVSVVFVSDDDLLEMNRQYLDHDYFTDIITFDYCEEDEVLGDLFVSVDRVRDNAANLNAVFEDELYRVLVHGVLHLCGYGDKSVEEGSVMRQKEDFYLNKLKGFT